MDKSDQKIKLLYIYDILCKETDETHCILREDLCYRLNRSGISSNVRTLSGDIKVLNRYGFEVMERYVGHAKGYYVVDRPFSIPELKILIDAVQAASFVTEKKSAELIKKISDLGGKSNSSILSQTMVHFNTRKHSNESILYSVDTIENAILRKKAISFFYFDLTPDVKKKYRPDDKGNRKRYTVEPVSLIFNEDNYYLMAYSKNHPGSTASYRVDRMDQVEVVDQSDISKEALGFRKNIGEYTEQFFKMFNGESVSVKLSFDRSLLGPVFDRFGEDAVIEQTKNENIYTAKADVRISPVFYGWVFQFGGKMKILSPKSVANEYEEMKKS